MKVLLIGATGFVGRPLVRALYQRGDSCTVISRSGRDPWRQPRVDVVQVDPAKPGAWTDHVARCDAVVNLAGERIIDPTRRWTAQRKKLLRKSRIDVTRIVARAIKESRNPPAVFLNASAIGYYGPRGDAVIDEDTGPGKDFLGELCTAWEAAAKEASDAAPVCLLRTGMVLGRGGGVLGSLLPLFKSGLGGPWGDGKQWWSWIHMTDEVGLILFALDRRLSGPLNLTAPEPVTVNEFAEALGGGLRRPSLLRAPAAMLKLALGESATALLASQRVLPTQALRAGYSFAFRSLYQALDDLL
ncbi:MAG: TIGR01777 family oxidoreductase [Gemmatimonadota bacterium]|nr:MAG: TIGR01777 family oxidoreductase [Gemmatimonadota bacterium]